MPPCGEDNIPKELKGLVDGGAPMAVPMPPYGPFKDEPGEDTNKPFVRDLTVDELEELVEKAVRRVLQGEDIKREFARLQAARKK